MRVIFLGLLVLIAIGFTSCEKDIEVQPDPMLVSFLEDDSATDKLLTSVMEDKDEDGHTKYSNCFELSGSISYIMPDGTSITGDRKTVTSDLKKWYYNNPNSKEKPIIQFPIDLIFEEEIVKTVHNKEELELVLKACKKESEDDKDDAHHKDCFEFIGDVTYVMPDGSNISGNQRTIRSDMKAWYEANPDSKEAPTLQFPVELVFEDRSTLTINNEAALKAAYEACGG